MKISTKGRYGLRVILELALHYGNGAVSMDTISKNQDISVKYLHNILTRLKHANLVRAIRGSEGGFVMSQPPSQTTASDVVQAMEGPFELIECISNPALCKRSPQCVTMKVWSDLGKVMENFLSSMTIEYLVQQQKNKQNLTFHI